MLDIPLKEIMVTQVITGLEGDSLASVEEKMRLHKIRHVPIIDTQKKLTGIVTYRDLLSCTPPRRTEDGLVFDKEQMNQFILKHMMTKNPQALAPTDTIAHVVAIMTREKYSCIPIVAGDKTLLGIVTHIDVLKWLGKQLQSGVN